MSIHTQDRAGATSSAAANQTTKSTTRTAARSTSRRRSGSPQRQGNPLTTLAGTYSQHQRGFGFIALAEPHLDGDTSIDSVFVNPSLAATLVAGDIVEVGASVSGGRAAAKKIRSLTRTRTHLFGRIRAAEKPATGLVLDVDAHVAAGVCDLAPQVKVRAGQWVYARIEPTTKPGHLGRVVEVVEVYDQVTPAALRRMTFARFDLDLGRDSAVDAAAVDAAARGRAALAGPVGPDRVDHTDETTFTVDGASTRDLDDAISAHRVTGGVRVRVHIADVSALVTPGSVLDDDAHAYATSVYLPGWNRPMLPPQLSEDVLSLLPGVPRDTLTVTYTVTDDGDLVDVEVSRARIVSDARLTYDSATAMIDAGTGPAPVWEALATAYDASLLLGRERSARLQLGERDRPVPDWEVDVAATGNDDAYDGATLVAKPTTPPTLADEMIERLMVAANEAVATWLLDRDLPGVFRVHDEPTDDLGEDIAALVPFLPRAVRHKVDVDAAGVASLAALAEELEAHDVTDRLVDVLLMRHLKRAVYAADCGDHYGLGSTGYVHFTSPIRRYADLLVHRVITAHLDGDADAVEVLDAEMAAQAAHVTAASWTAARIESGFRRFATELLYPTQAPGTVAGVVTGFSPDAVFVSAPDHGVSGVLPFAALDGVWKTDQRKVATTQQSSGHTLTLGSRVWVTMTDVDPGLVGVTWARSKRPTRRTRR